MEKVNAHFFMPVMFVFFRFGLKYVTVHNIPPEPCLADPFCLPFRQNWPV